MGASASSSKINASTDPGPFLKHDLPKFIVEAEMPHGSGRMMRGFRIRSSEGGVILVCKATIVRYEDNNSTVNNGNTSSLNEITRNNENEDIRSIIYNHAKELKKIWETIGSDPEKFPNVLPYQRWIISDYPVRDTRSGFISQPIYLIRQHCFATLSDRLAMRPFLTFMEKLWIAYQVLKALESIHEMGICHGSVTCENICVTSWGWVLLTDFSVKPVIVPDYDLSDYILHFEKVGDGEKRCYVAPERFYSKPSEAPSQLKAQENANLSQKLAPEMDIFSAGCVFIETFLNGEKAFDIGDLMEYRNKCSLMPALKQKLNKIDSSSIRAACKHMLSLDPSARLSASSYLRRLSAVKDSKAKDINIGKDITVGINKQNNDEFEVPLAPIPRCFEEFFWPLMRRLRHEVYTPDSRIALFASLFPEVLKYTVGFRDVQAESYFKNILGTNAKSLSTKANCSDSILDEKIKSNTCLYLDASLTSKFQDLLEKTENLLQQLEKSESDLDFFETYGVLTTNLMPQSSHKSNTIVKDKVKCSNEIESNAVSNINLQSQSAPALEIYLQLILSTMRFVLRPSSKIVALQILSFLSKYVSDEARLQRITPILVTLLDDQDAMVKAVSIRALSYTLSIIQSFPPSDAKLFPEYIFKRLNSTINCDQLVVRVAFSESLSVFAEVAKRFLDINHATNLYESLSSSNGERSSSVPESTTIQEHSDFPQFPDILPPSNTELDNNKKSPQSHLNITSNPVNVDLPVTKKTFNRTNYEEDLSSLQEHISRWVVQITTENTSSSVFMSSAPKRALLRDLTRLCSFFGRDGVISRILPQILAFLNDRNDWQLRTSLCQSLPSVCSIIGRVAVEQFVLPVIETALTDDNDQVIHSALISLMQLGKLGLLHRVVFLGKGPTRNPETQYVGKMTTNQDEEYFGLIEKYSPFLLHPSEIVRNGISSLICGCCEIFGYPDDKVFVLPIIKPYIRFEPSSETLHSVEKFLSCLLPAVKAITPSLDEKNDNLIVKNNSDQIENQSNGMLVADKKLDIENLNLINDKGLGVTTSDENKVQKAFLLESKNFRDVLSSLAYTFSIPDQKFLELTASPLPDWYYFQYLSKELSLKFTETHLSMPFLIHVYGLSMTQPSNFAQIRKSKHAGDIVDLNSFEIIQQIESVDKIQGSFTRNENAHILHEWGTFANVEPSLFDASLLLSKLNCLQIPPLPPRLGVLREIDGKPFSSHSPFLDKFQRFGNDRKKDWKSRGIRPLVSSSPHSSHTSAVSRLALAQDNSFFVSSSHDGTCKVFGLRDIEDSSFLESSLVYDGHLDETNKNHVRVNDICMIENSHSIASGDSSGNVHIWRVDMVNSKPNQIIMGKNHFESCSPSESSVIRTVKQDEGEIVAVSHFNTSSSSTVIFSTQRGIVHSWDLRSQREPFQMKVNPELGSFTSMAVANDRNWMVTGTNFGYLSLWDLRYQKLVKLWQKNVPTPISRLATCYTTFLNCKQGKSPGVSSPKPYIFLASGLNEASIYDLTNGICCKCFRVLDPSLTFVEQSALPDAVLAVPKLNAIRLPSTYRNRIFPTLDFVKIALRRNAPEPSVQAIVGKLGSRNQNFVITGSTDRCIRYWDLDSASNCHTISGLQHEQIRPIYEQVNIGHSNIFLCRQYPPVSGESKNDLRTKFYKDKKNKLCGNSYQGSHSDAVLDLKSLEFPVKGLLSASRDGTVKLWS